MIYVVIYTLVSFLAFTRWIKVERDLGNKIGFYEFFIALFFGVLWFPTLIVIIGFIICDWIKTIATC